ncbi:hypothetical protein BDZ45DRAFT_740323 [Acephala macrosclerotiorum]|nr:hypothetical protein BDZ45DRAFT_740323 [Acephala macrosclerotiorum]
MLKFKRSRQLAVTLNKLNSVTPSIRIVVQVDNNNRPAHCCRFPTENAALNDEDRLTSLNLVFEPFKLRSKRGPFHLASSFLLFRFSFAASQTITKSPGLRSLVAPVGGALRDSAKPFLRTSCTRWLLPTNYQVFVSGLELEVIETARREGGNVVQKKTEELVISLLCPSTKDVAEAVGDNGLWGKEGISGSPPTRVRAGSRVVVERNDDSSENDDQVEDELQRDPRPPKTLYSVPPNWLRRSNDTWLRVGDESKVKHEQPVGYLLRSDGRYESESEERGSAKSGGDEEENI